MLWAKRLLVIDKDIFDDGSELRLSPVSLGRFTHPRPVYAVGFAGLQCQSAEALAKAGKRMIQ
jgi:hypothetical protein